MGSTQSNQPTGQRSWRWGRRGLVFFMVLATLLPTLVKPVAAQSGAVCINPLSMNYSGTIPTYNAAPAGWSIANGKPSMVAATNPSNTGSGGTINHISGPSRSGGAVVHVYGSSSTDYGVIQSSLTNLTVGQAYTVAIEWQRTQVTNGGVSYYLDGDLSIEVQGNSRRTYTTSSGAAADDWTVAEYSFTATSTSAWIAVGVVAGSGSQSSKNPSIVFDAGNVCTSPAVCINPLAMNYSGTIPTYNAAPAGWSIANGKPSMVAATNPSNTGSGGTINHISGPSTSGGAVVHVYSTSSTDYGMIQSSLTNLTIGQAYTVAIEWQRTQVTNGGVSYYLDGDLSIEVQGNSRQSYTTSSGAATDDWTVAEYPFIATSSSAWIAVGVVAGSGSQSSKNPSIVFDAGNACAPVGPDSDNDGIPDATDLDDDNDGIPDTVEAATARNNGDTDGDGIIDSLDLDSDNDGILDITESGRTTGTDGNGDGRLDGPVGTDGIPDSVQAAPNGGTINYAVVDTDGDSRPDFQDLDSDNDGINDVREANGTDANGDGLADGPVNGNGVPGSVPAAGLTPPDTDGDGKPDFRDLDSDNDAINDVIEGSAGTYPDANGDGIVDGGDSDGDGIKDAVDGSPAFGDANDPAPTNSDNDGTPDYRDLDSDNDGLTDLRESGVNPAVDGNNDGKVDDASDPDNDGIPAPVDGAPATYGDANSPTLPDGNGNGTPDYRDPAGATPTNTPVGPTPTPVVPTPTPGSGATAVVGDRVWNDINGNGVQDIGEPGVPGVTVQVLAGCTGTTVVATKLTNSNGEFVIGGLAAGQYRLQVTLPAGYTGFSPKNAILDDDYDSEANADGLTDCFTLTSGQELYSLDVGLVTGGPAPTNTPVGPTATPTNTPVGPTPTATPGSGGTAVVGDYVWNDINGNGVQDGGAERGVPGVTVQLLAGCTGTTVVATKVTNSNGEFTINGLAAGQYRLQVTLPAGYTGFSPKDSILDNDYDSDVNPNGVSDCFTLANGQELYTVDAGLVSGGATSTATPVGPTVTPTNTPAGPDSDNDGIPDATDLDDDNDGIPDTVEAATARNNGDTDGDGIIDSLDLDSDNDGILDITESGRTTGTDGNGDGRLDGPVGTDGIPDSVQPAPNGGTINYAVVDTDGDSRPDFQDLDSDNDGINDVREANGTDTNGDGKADQPVNGNGVPGSVPAAGLTPPDTDGDGKPDFRDLDSDNDAINDIIEGSAGTYPDANGDGIVDGGDSDGDGIKDAVDGSPAFGDANDPTPTNSDNDGTPDFRDLDSDNDGLTDLRESGVNPAVDGNNDGKVDDASDPDNDGIPAPVDGAPATYGDANSPTLPDGNGNGTPDYRDPAGVTPTATPVGPTPTPVGPTPTPGSGTAIVGDRVWNDINGNGVQDIGERGVAGVTVQVLAGCSGSTVVATKQTNHAGDYVISNLPAGQYRIKVTLPAGYTGFSPKDTILDDDYDSDVNPDGVSDCFTLATGEEKYTVDAGLVTGGPTPTSTPVGPTPTPTNTPVGPTPTPTATPTGGPGGFICDDGICPDSDGDGIADYLDDDDDNDGIPTADEDVNNNGDLTDDDSDGDGIPDYLDPLDTDGDTIPDLVEDANNDGNPANDDTDGDGTPDYLDTDSDNDGIPDSVEVGIRPSRPYDADRDRIPNYRDLDSDNDGKPDSVEGTISRDGDGIPDYIDPDDNGPGSGDSDGDGVPDAVECPPAASGAALQDTDRDGIPDYMDTDQIFRTYLSTIQR